MKRCNFQNLSLIILINCLLLTTTLVAQSAWQVTADQIDPNEYYGVTVANGMIGLVSSAQPLKVQDVVLNGVYDNYQRGRVSNILKGFNHMNMRLFVDGEQIHSDNISNYQQVLDMREAKLVTTFRSGKVEVVHELLALRHLPYSSLIQLKITNYENQPISISPQAIIEAPDHLSDVRNYYSEIDRPHVLIPLLTSVAKSPTGSQTLAASVSFIFPEAHGNQPDIVHEDWDYNMHLAKFNKLIAPGESYTFSLIGSTCATEHYQDPHNEAERLTIFGMLEGTDRLLRKHREGWDELWSTGDILVEGNVDMERDIRFALYHLYSFSRKGTSYSLSPMGLSGLGYNGHVFWDTELWMYPPLLLLQPEIARSLLDYRFDRLEAAKQNALAHGYKGAMYPWESADDGSEDTPVWALTGPFQHHITGCVAWAHWKYFQVTGDMEWLRNRGWPVIEAAAEFWASRVERNGPGRYDINNVIGANEWEENIDNNAFTNAMAITTLRYATEAAQKLGIVPDPDWNHVADNIPILNFSDGTTRENATYNGAMIKQADVNLLAYPLGFYTTQSQIEKDLAYYTPRLSPNGPAMGAAILSVLYNRLGNPQKSAEIFVESYKHNEVPPFGVIAETSGGTNPYFATGAGGMLQAVLAGFGGIQMTNDGVTQRESSIPVSWKRLVLIGVGINENTFEVMAR